MINLTDFSFTTPLVCASNVNTARSLKNLKLGQPVFISGLVTAADGGGGLFVYTTATVADDGDQLLSVVGGGGLIRATEAPTFEAPTNTALPTITGTAQVGQKLTYVPGTWTGSPTIIATWIMDGTVRIGDATTPLWLSPVNAYGVITVEEVGSTLGGTVTVNSSGTSAVTLSTTPFYTARETFDAGISAVSPVTAPQIGNATYQNVFQTGRKAGGGLYVNTATDFDSAWIYLNVGASNQKHVFTFTALEHCYLFEVGFCLSASSFVGDGGSDTGYLLAFTRFSPAADWAITLKKYAGGGANGVQLGSSATLVNGASLVSVEVDASTATLNLTINRDNGADIIYSISDNTYRSATVYQRIMRKTTGDTLMTFDAGLSEPESFLVGDRYALVFADEFNDTDTTRFKTGGSLSSTQWATRPPYWPQVINGEYQRYTDVSDPGNIGSPIGRQPFSLQGGALRITATRLTALEAQQYDWPGYNNTAQQWWVSGELRKLGGYAQRYGYIEIRAKCPLGRGAWPAIWGLPEGDVAPPEYDILECDGDRPTKNHFATHEGSYGGGLDTGTASGFVDMKDGKRIDQYHVYALLWTPTSMSWFVDGQQVFAAGHAMHFKMYTLLSLAVGSGFNTPDWVQAPNLTTPSPMHMDIDYVRCWQRPSQVSTAPNVTAYPVISIAGEGVGAVVTITHGTATGAATTNRYLRKDTIKIAGTDGATTFTLTASETGGKKINFFEEYISAGGVKSHVVSNWIWSP